MTFDNPGTLRFLLLLVFFIVLMALRYRKDRERVSLFAIASRSGERGSVLRELRQRLIIAHVFFLFFMGFLIVALAGPRWGFRIVNDYRRGVDVVLAFDLSQSMNVQDCFDGRERISRLDRAVEIAGDLTAYLGDVRLGVAIGKGSGVLAVPLTYDDETIFSFLYGIDTETITGTGTNLESIINAASEAFQDSIPSRRAIVLFSDGEALSGSFQEAVDKMRRTGISLSAAGMGSNEGGPVPSGLPYALQQDFLQTDEGVPVISRRQENILRFGADRTGGVYVDGSRRDAAMVLSNFINSLSAESRLYGYRREANPRWQIFIFAAMACLLGSRLMGFSQRRQKGKKSGINDARASARRVSSISILLCVFLLSSCGRAQGKLLVMEGNFYNARGFYTEAITSYMKALNLEAPYAEYGLGSAYFALEEGNAAMERYKAAAASLENFRPEHHTELRYRLYYNTGIIHFEKGNYEEAARAFRDALKVDSSRIDAKRNLELSLLTITRNNAPQTASSSGGDEGRQDDSGGSSAIIFEYLREMEQEHWKSRRWTGESNYSGPDY